MTAQQAAEAVAESPQRLVPNGSHGSGATLVRAGLAPVVCAAALIALLSAWVATGGAGTVSRVTIKVGQAAITLPSSSAPDRAAMYLTITNLGAPDTLLSVRSPEGGRVIFVRHSGSAAGPGVVLRQLSIPDHATVSLSPFGSDIVLQNPGSLTVGGTVLLVLTFRHAGRVTVYAAVTPPGTP